MCVCLLQIRIWHRELFFISVDDTNASVHYTTVETVVRHSTWRKKLDEFHNYSSTERQRQIPFTPSIDRFSPSCLFCFLNNFSASSLFAIRPNFRFSACISNKHIYYLNVTQCQRSFNSKQSTTQTLTKSVQYENENKNIRRRRWRRKCTQIQKQKPSNQWWSNVDCYYLFVFSIECIAINQIRATKATPWTCISERTTTNTNDSASAEWETSEMKVWIMGGRTKRT